MCSSCSHQSNPHRAKTPVSTETETQTCFINKSRNEPIGVMDTCLLSSDHVNLRDFATFNVLTSSFDFFVKVTGNVSPVCFPEVDSFRGFFSRLIFPEVVLSKSPKTESSCFLPENCLSHLSWNFSVLAEQNTTFYLTIHMFHTPTGSELVPHIQFMSASKDQLLISPAFCRMKKEKGGKNQNLASWFIVIRFQFSHFAKRRKRLCTRAMGHH